MRTVGKGNVHTNSKGWLSNTERTEHGALATASCEALRGQSRSKEVANLQSMLYGGLPTGLVEQPWVCALVAPRWSKCCVQFNDT